MDHINCRCNVGHIKESNAEAFWIIKSEPTLTLQKVPSFPLFHPVSHFPDYIIRNPCVIRTASESFGRWYAPHRTRLSDVLDSGQVKKMYFTTFLDYINGGKKIWSLPPYKYSSKPHHFSYHSLPSSPPLSSTTMIFHR